MPLQPVHLLRLLHTQDVGGEIGAPHLNFFLIYLRFIDKKKSTFNI